MNAARYVRTLSQHVAGLRTTAQHLAEARQAGQETATSEALLLHQITDYGWAVRNRVWLLSSAQALDAQALSMPIEELHIRLLAVETLVQARLGQPLVHPAEPTDLSPASPELVQRLAAAESRLFHLYHLFPLN